MMIELASKNKCTGCMACVQACPLNVVSVKEDEFGDRYPQIDRECCVSCGKCAASCPALCLPAAKRPEQVYAVWSLDNRSRKASASGGAAAEMYLQALQNGYYICGAEYNERLRVVHTVSRDAAAVDRFRQSKYVYSDFSHSYAEIRELLRSGEKVLCISLPCKIAGLLTFLGGVHKNLVTVDIVCHGTPSEKQLQDHLLQYTTSTESCRLHFREDNQFMVCLRRRGKTVCRNVGRTDTYLAAFLEGLNYRPACYSCQYAKPERTADITICDFWGLGQEIPFDHPYSGSISAVLINTEKGRAFFETARSRFFVEERPVEEAIKGNDQLQHPTPGHKKREQFEKLYLTKGFDKAVKECLAEEMQREKRAVSKMLLKSRLRSLAGLLIKKYRS